MLTKYIEVRLVEEDTEDAIWEKWREMNRNGVTEYSDNEIRNLHARMSLLLSEAELNYANFDGKADVRKLHKDLEEAKLLYTTYTEGAMNARQAQVKADDRYREIVMEIEDFVMTRALWKGRLTATASAVETLSREISYRIKLVGH